MNPKLAEGKTETYHNYPINLQKPQELAMPGMSGILDTRGTK